MTDYPALPLGDNCPHTVTAVIEIPQDSVNKYEYDKQMKVFRHILVLGDAPSFQECVLTARPIGVFEMLDQGILDEKVLAYAIGNPRFTTITNYADVMPHALLEVAHFFSVYKDLEGKRTEVLGWKDADSAFHLIQRCHDKFMRSNKNIGNEKVLDR